MSNSRYFTVLQQSLLDDSGSFKSFDGSRAVVMGHPVYLNNYQKEESDCGLILASYNNNIGRYLKINNTK